MELTALTEGEAISLENPVLEEEVKEANFCNRAPGSNGFTVLLKIILGCD